MPADTVTGGPTGRSPIRSDARRGYLSETEIVDRREHLVGSVADTNRAASESETLFEGLLWGRRLVEFVCGPQPDEASYRRARRRFYRLIGTAGLPAFRLGAREFAARPDALRDWLAARERKPP